MIKIFATYPALNVDYFEKRPILTIFANSKALFSGKCIFQGSI
jgi:hypothetical protein